MLGSALQTEKGSAGDGMACSRIPEGWAGLTDLTPSPYPPQNPLVPWNLRGHGAQVAGLNLEPHSFRLGAGQEA